MKGTNTLIVNPEQMVEIAQEWWNKHTYTAKSYVALVVQGDDGNFEITLEEPLVNEDEPQ